ncbi:MAG: hypothetical protein AB7R69_05475 [Candidatus Babeliales bacterium]
MKKLLITLTCTLTCGLVTGMEPAIKKPAIPVPSFENLANTQKSGPQCPPRPQKINFDFCLVLYQD